MLNLTMHLGDMMITLSNEKTFRVTGPLCGEFTSHRWIPHPHKGQWRGALMAPLMCIWTNEWANNRDVGDLRHHHVHYDVTEMWIYVHIRCGCKYNSWPVMVTAYIDRGHIFSCGTAGNLQDRLLYSHIEAKTKMATLLQTSFSNSFSCMVIAFWFKFQ